jgi:uncharacterized protein (DUF2267 family)
MSSDIFAKHVQTTHEWLKSIADYTGWDDPFKTLAALRATLHHLRDHLPNENSAHLSAQLPLLIRGLYFEGWNPSHVPLRERKRFDFIAAVAAALAPSLEIDAEEAVKAVFFALEQKLSPGEVIKVRNALPSELKDLWAEANGKQLAVGNA